MLTAVVDLTFEGVLVWKGWNSGLASMAGAKYDMFWRQGAFDSAALELYCPYLGVVAIDR